MEVVMAVAAKEGATAVKAVGMVGERTEAEGRVAAERAGGPRSTWFAADDEAQSCNHDRRQASRLGPLAEEGARRHERRSDPCTATSCSWPRQLSLNRRESVQSLGRDLGPWRRPNGPRRRTTFRDEQSSAMTSLQEDCQSRRAAQDPTRWRRDGPHRILVACRVR